MRYAPVVKWWLTMSLGWSKTVLFFLLLINHNVVKCQQTEDTTITESFTADFTQETASILNTLLPKRDVNEARVEDKDAIDGELLTDEILTNATDLSLKDDDLTSVENIFGNSEENMLIDVTEIFSNSAKFTTENALTVQDKDNESNELDVQEVTTSVSNSSNDNDIFEDFYKNSTEEESTTLRNSGIKMNEFVKTEKHEPVTNDEVEEIYGEEIIDDKKINEYRTEYYDWATEFYRGLNDSNEDVVTEDIVTEENTNDVTTNSKENDSTQSTNFDEETHTRPESTDSVTKDDFADGKKITENDLKSTLANKAISNNLTEEQRFQSKISIPSQSFINKTIEESVVTSKSSDNEDTRHRIIEVQNTSHPMTDNMETAEEKDGHETSGTNDYQVNEEITQLPISSNQTTTTRITDEDNEVTNVEITNETLLEITTVFEVENEEISREDPELTTLSDRRITNKDFEIITESNEVTNEFSNEAINQPTNKNTVTNEEILHEASTQASTENNKVVNEETTQIANEVTTQAITTAVEVENEETNRQVPELTTLSESKMTNEESEIITEINEVTDESSNEVNNQPTNKNTVTNEEIIHEATTQATTAENNKFLNEEITQIANEATTQAINNAVEVKNAETTREIPELTTLSNRKITNDDSEINNEVTNEYSNEATNQPTNVNTAMIEEIMHEPTTQAVTENNKVVSEEITLQNSETTPITEEKITNEETTFQVTTQLHSTTTEIRPETTTKEINDDTIEEIEATETTSITGEKIINEEITTEATAQLHSTEISTETKIDKEKISNGATGQTTTDASNEVTSEEIGNEATSQILVTETNEVMNEEITRESIEPIVIIEETNEEMTSTTSHEVTNEEIINEATRQIIAGNKNEKIILISESTTVERISDEESEATTQFPSTSIDVTVQTKVANEGISNEATSQASTDEDNEDTNEDFVSEETSEASITENNKVVNEELVDEVTTQTITDERITNGEINEATTQFRSTSIEDTAETEVAIEGISSEATSQATSNANNEVTTEDIVNEETTQPIINENNEVANEEMVNEVTTTVIANERITSEETKSEATTQLHPTSIEVTTETKFLNEKILNERSQTTTDRNNQVTNKDVVNEEANQSIITKNYEIGNEEITQKNLNSMTNEETTTMNKNNEVTNEEIVIEITTQTITDKLHSTLAEITTETNNMNEDIKDVNQKYETTWGTLTTDLIHEANKETRNEEIPIQDITKETFQPIISGNKNEATMTNFEDVIEDSNEEKTFVVTEETIRATITSGNVESTTYTIFENTNEEIEEGKDILSLVTTEKIFESAVVEVRKEENIVTTDGNKVTKEQNNVTREANEENEATTEEIKVTTEEIKVTTEENKIITEENKITTEENEATKEENNVGTELLLFDGANPGRKNTDATVDNAVMFTVEYSEPNLWKSFTYNPEEENEEFQSTPQSNVRDTMDNKTDEEIEIVTESSGIRSTDNLESITIVTDEETIQEITRSNLLENVNELPSKKRPQNNKEYSNLNKEIEDNKNIIEEKHIETPTIKNNVTVKENEEMVTKGISPIAHSKEEMSQTEESSYENIKKGNFTKKVVSTDQENNLITEVHTNEDNTTLKDYTTERGRDFYETNATVNGQFGNGNNINILAEGNDVKYEDTLIRNQFVGHTLSQENSTVDLKTNSGEENMRKEDNSEVQNVEKEIIQEEVNKTSTDNQQFYNDGGSLNQLKGQIIEETTNRSSNQTETDEDDAADETNIEPSKESFKEISQRIFKQYIDVTSNTTNLGSIEEIINGTLSDKIKGRKGKTNLVNSDEQMENGTETVSSIVEDFVIGHEETTVIDDGLETTTSDTRTNGVKFSNVQENDKDLQAIDDEDIIQSEKIQHNSEIVVDERMDQSKEKHPEFVNYKYNSSLREEQNEENNVTKKPDEESRQIPYISVKISNENGQMCLTGNLSMKIILQHSNVTVPETARTTGSCSRSVCKIQTTWIDVLQATNTNSTIYLDVAIKGDFYFINAVRLNVFLQTSKEVEHLDLTEENLQILKTNIHDEMRGFHTFDLGGVDLHLNNVDLILRQNSTVDLGLLKTKQSKFSSDVAILITGACLVASLVIGAVVFVLFKKCRRTGAIYKMTIE